MRRSIFILTAAALLFLGCEKRKVPFGLDHSPIRYVEATFQDKDVYAQAGDIQIRRQQIALSSAVMRDLNQQELEAQIALTYIKILKENSTNPDGEIIFFIPSGSTNLERALSRFGIEPRTNLKVAFAAPKDPDTLAIFRGHPILRSEVDRSHFVFQEIDRKRFLETAQQLNTALVSSVIRKQAESAGLSESEWIERLQKSPGQFPKEEFNRYLLGVGEVESALAPELRKRHLASFLEKRRKSMIEEHLAQGPLKDPVKVALRRPTNEFPMNTKFRALAGEDDAPIAIVVFASPSCTDCLNLVDGIQAVVKRFGEHVRLNWIYHHAEAEGPSNGMARAGLCIETLHPRKMFDFLFHAAKAKQAVDDATLKSWVGAWDIDEEKFRSCLFSETTTELLNQHFAYSRGLGIVLNPSVWIDGSMVEGPTTAEQISRIVSEKIQLRGEGRLSLFWRRCKRVFRNFFHK